MASEINIFSFLFIIIMNSQRATIDDFSMLTVLGKGAFAKVLLVRHNTSQKVFAMKIIPKKNVSAKKQESFIKIERNVLVEVNHPFIIRMFYAFQNPKKLFFVLEFCPGGELYRQIAKKHRLPQDHTRFYAAQMVLALEYLHARNIVYRDLKPQNVLIDGKGYIRLTDFGLSDMEEDVVTNRGTFEYLAPEVLNKEASGKGVDWWCLGNIIFEMATGLPPFYANGKAQVAEKIRAGEPNYPKSMMSSKLKELIELLLIKDPSKRLGSKGAAEIKQHPWFSKMDWKKLQEKEVAPPHVPFVESQIDTTNFDTEFTECEVNSHDERKSMEEEFEHFPNFSWENKFSVVDMEIKDSDSDSDSDIGFEMVEISDTQK